jgi:F0F1-type ATP synthase assembly protein I
MPSQQTQRSGTGRAYALGFEFACAVAGFVLIGFWIDRHYSSGPWGTLICLVLGLVGAFYNLIRGTSRLNGSLRAAAPGVPPPAERPDDDPHR